jgi:ketosteroid isomerase-like protein
MLQGTFTAMRRGAWWAAAGIVVAACADAGDPQAEIVAMLARSAADWNRGDLDGFMSDYARDSALSYVSGRDVLYGWQQLRDRYDRVYFAPGAARDSLAFERVHARAIAPAIAVATARFRLLRGDSLVASGPFTLVLARRGGRWQILHDHTSADPEPRRDTTSRSKASRNSVP